MIGTKIPRCPPLVTMLVVVVLVEAATKATPSDPSPLSHPQVVRSAFLSPRKCTAIALETRDTVTKMIWLYVHCAFEIVHVY